VLTVERVLGTTSPGARGGLVAAAYADVAALRRVAAKLAAPLPPESA
jgi:hypothetical protein